MQRKPDDTLALVKCSNRSEIGPVVDIMSAAFERDPAMVHFVGEAEAPHAARSDIVTAIVQSHFCSKEPVFLLLQNGEPVGAALVEVRRSAFGEFLGVLKTWKLWRRLPKGCPSRMNAFRASSRQGCDKTTIYLMMIGIRPEAQGKGHGRHLIEMLEADIGTERGWSLDTENPENVTLYERLGYAVIGEVAWEDNTIYQMQKSAV